LGVLLSTDYAIVGESSQVGSLYAGVGLTPDLSVTAHLARAVGERRALQLTLSHRLLSAREALEWGSWPRSSPTTTSPPAPRRSPASGSRWPTRTGRRSGSSAPPLPAASPSNCRRRLTRSAGRR